MTDMIVAFSLAFITTIMVRRLVIKMISSTSNLRKNYQGHLIPVSAGIVFIPGILIAAIASMGLISYQPSTLLEFLFLIMLAQLIGLLDDQVGDRTSTGLTGHFRKLLKGELTTGAFKAISVLLGGVVIAVIISKTLIDVVLNVLLICLFTNFINLLDLRPGRALKVFTAIALSLLVTFLNRGNENLYLLIMLGVVWGYISLDLKAISMLGDCGSNTLGIVLGFYCAKVLVITEKASLVCLLLLVHIIAEKWSFTKIIERNRLLTYFDKVGRKI